MKRSLIALASLFLIASVSGHATDGRSTGCFGLGVFIYQTFPAAGPAKILRTPGSLCVVEQNMVEAGDDTTSTGDITITIRDGKHKAIAKYSLGAKSSEGAAGTFYSVYAVDTASLLTDDTWDKVTFAMRNDHIKIGQYAGRVTLNGSELVLIQK